VDLWNSGPVSCAEALGLMVVYCTDCDSSFEVKTEAVSNDITKHLHDDKPTIESRG